jgi:hypothetical protein
MPVGQRKRLRDGVVHPGEVAEVSCLVLFLFTRSASLFYALSPLAQSFLSFVFVIPYLTLSPVAVFICL